MFCACAGSVELKNAVSARFGIELPATVSFDYPTIQAMAGYIAQQQQGASGAGAAGMQPAGQDLEAVRQAVLATLLETAASLIGAEVAPDQPLMEAGLDSIGALITAHALRFGSSMHARTAGLTAQLGHPARCMHHALPACIA